MADRNPQNGFTLIEALVALAVISVAAVALIAASEATLRNIYSTEISRAASWVADAELTKIELGAPTNPTPSGSIFQMEFDVRVNLAPVVGSGLEKVTLEVYARSSFPDDMDVLARQIGFRAAPNEGP